MFIWRSDQSIRRETDEQSATLDALDRVGRSAASHRTEKCVILKKIGQAAAVAGLALASLSVTTSAHAGDFSCAADCYVSQSQYITIPAHTAKYEARVNNNQTGNGVTSWIWVYAGKDDWPHVDYYLNGDPNMHQKSGYPNAGKSENLSLDVTAFRVCGKNGWGGSVCSDWAHPSY